MRHHTRRHAQRPAHAEPPHRRRRAGKADFGALLREAYARRMVSIAVLFSLAFAYERKIDELLAGTTGRNTAKAAVTPSQRPTKRAAPEPAADADTPPPAKKGGRKPKENPKGGTAAAKGRAEARGGQRHRKRLWDWMAQAWRTGVSGEIKSGSCARL